MGQITVPRPAAFQTSGWRRRLTRVTSGQDAAGVPDIKIAHSTRTGWHVQRESSVYVAYESQRRGSRSP